jgi:hypothetical protein
VEFRSWAAAVRDRLRALLPGVVATIRRDGAVVLRYDQLTATLKPESDVTWIHFTNAGGAPPMASLWMKERTAENAGILAGTIAGYFDARLSRPDR